MSHICLNCGTESSDRFCPHCGQKTATKRITFPHLVQEIPHSVLHLEKGFFFTLLQLFRRPGAAIREYVEGKRVNFYKPLAYLLILSAVSSLISHLQISYIEHVRNIHISLSPYLFSAKLATFFAKYPALMFVLTVPVSSLWSFLFNRQSGFNYAENLVLNMYLVAQFNLFIVLNNLISMALGLLGGSVTPLLTIYFFYTVIVYRTFFRSRNLLRSILMYVFLVLTMITALSVCGFMTPWWGIRVP